MDITTAFLSAQQLLLAAVVMGVVSVAKASGMPSQWAPLSSLALGVAIVFLLPSATIQMTILAGLTVGLVASGAYSAGKTTFNAANATS